jgi:hypothetical protein
VVADTNHHRVIAVDVHTGDVAEVQIHDDRAPQQSSGTALAGGAGTKLVISADVDLAGSELDIQQGPPVHVNVSADPPSLLGPGPRAWGLDALPVSVEIRLGRPGAGVLTVDVIASTCEGDVCTIRRNTREHSLTVVT